jgi:sporulation protein YlmC with PRC-barrel domain
MRKLLGLSVSALMIAAAPAFAQEATPQTPATTTTTAAAAGAAATTPAQPATTTTTTDGAGATTTPAQPATTTTTTEGAGATTTPAQPATTTTTAAQPATTTTTAAQPAATTQPAAPATTSTQPMAQGPNAMTDAIAALQQAIDQFNQAGGGGAGAGAGGAAAPDAGAAGGGQATQQNVDQLRTALDQFEQAYQQQQQQPVAGQADLQPLIDQARQELDTDPNQAVGTLQQVADQASETIGVQQQANVPAEADRIVGRTVVTSNGDEAGEVADVLVTSNGQVEALLITRGGVLGLGEQQVMLPWDQVQLQGDQLMVNMTAEQIDALPEYTTD